MHLESALTKLRQSAEMALGYPDAHLTAGEARAILQHISAITATNHLLTDARDEWYAKEARLRKSAESKNAELRRLREALEASGARARR